MGLPSNAAGAVQRSDAYKGLADAEGEGSAVGEGVVEVIIAVCTLPLDLNILTAVAEITRAGTNKVHFTMSLLIDNAIADIKDNNICKVNVLIVAVRVLGTADKCIVAIAISNILEGGCCAAEVLDGEFLGLLITLSCGLGAENKTILGVVAVRVLEVELLCSVLCDLVALSIEGMLIAYTADSVLITNPCAAAFAEGRINIADTVLLDIGSRLVAVAAMHINCVICLNEADIVGTSAADITDIRLTYIGEHGHHTGNITLDKRLINNACVGKTLAGTGAGVIVYHNTVRTGRTCIRLNGFTSKRIDRTGDDIVYGKSVSVDVGRFAVFFFFAAAYKQTANAANSKKK